MKAVLLTAGILCGELLSACVPKQDVVMTSSFDPAEAKYARLKGASRIEGQAFLKQVGGAVVTGAGEKVFLIPATTYTNELFAKTGTYRGAYAPQMNMNLDPMMKDYIKIWQADASGNFSFDGVAAGEYYLVTQVSWGVPTRYGLESQGGEMVERVTVGKTGTTKVIMTR